MRHWLMKTEPDVFSYDDLVAQRRAGWDGVRNYQTRNFMREMRRGDLVILYHSNATPPGAAGIARIVAEATPDPTQFDPASEYHDPRSTRDEPRWDLVTLAPKRRLDFVPLPNVLMALRPGPVVSLSRRQDGVGHAAEPAFARCSLEGKTRPQPTRCRRDSCNSRRITDAACRFLPARDRACKGSEHPADGVVDLGR
jgi:predicted RNA-binding protein with PUA-like domain